MIPVWDSLSLEERHSVEAAKAYLRDRLPQRATIDWALSLDASRRAERHAVNELLDGHPVAHLEQPYADGWRLIQESWLYDTSRLNRSLTVQDIQRRIATGECSLALIEKIVGLVEARLEVKAYEPRPGVSVNRNTNPVSVQDLFSATLTSIHLHQAFGRRAVDIGLSQVSNLSFLSALAMALMETVETGLFIAERIYGGEEAWGPSVLPARVYFDYRTTNAQEERLGHQFDQEPDRFNRGLAPSVKFLYMTVDRIAEIDTRSAAPFFHWLQHSPRSIYQRLWAAYARSPQLVGAEAVGDFLCSISCIQFWNVFLFPEIAELRAVRFADLDDRARRIVAERLEGGPPSDLWPRRFEAPEVEEYRRHFKAREMRRIEVAGGELPEHLQRWLAHVTQEYTSLANMTIESGFRGRMVRSIRSEQRQLAERYDSLEGEERLQALSEDLSGGEVPWQRDGVEQANAWLRKAGHAELLVADFEAVAGSEREYSNVWEAFGWYHHPSDEKESGREDAQAVADRTLMLMARLSEESQITAIGGISHWFQRWRRYVVRSENGLALWHRLWPICVAATNKDMEDEGEDDELVAYWKSQEADEGLADVDTLNSPVGRLVSVLLKAVFLQDDIGSRAVEVTTTNEMRDQVLAAPGISGLIARSLFVEVLPDFIEVDEEWAVRNLVGELLGEGDDPVLLWRAVAMRGLHTGTLRVIGEEASRRALDIRLGEPARESLVVSLVGECLRAFQECRDAAVPEVRLTQMLRKGDDEVRVHAAHAIGRFQEYCFDSTGANGAGEVFLSTTKVFLEQVWPQERSLASSAVSREFAEVPVHSGSAFGDAVEIIERFLIPFDCWSMFEYGFEEGDRNGLQRAKELQKVVDNAEKAESLLRLLDVTIGETETATIPYDLGSALERIEELAPKARSDAAFRRLSTAARR